METDYFFAVKFKNRFPLILPWSFFFWSCFSSILLTNHDTSSDVFTLVIKIFSSHFVSSQRLVCVQILKRAPFREWDVNKLFNEKVKCHVPTFLLVNNFFDDLEELYSSDIFLYIYINRMRGHNYTITNYFICIYIYIYIYIKNQLYCMRPLWTSKNHILFHTDIFLNCIPSSVYVCVKDTYWKCKQVCIIN